MGGSVIRESGVTLEEALEKCWKSVKAAEQEFFMSRDSDYIVYQNGIFRPDVRITATDDDENIPSLFNVTGQTDRSAANLWAMHVVENIVHDSADSKFAWVVCTHVHT
jgi:hypothetical protein